MRPRDRAGPRGPKPQGARAWPRCGDLWGPRWLCPAARVGVPRGCRVGQPWGARGLISWAERGSRSGYSWGSEEQVPASCPAQLPSRSAHCRPGRDGHAGNCRGPPRTRDCLRTHGFSPPAFLEQQVGAQDSGGARAASREPGRGSGSLQRGYGGAQETRRGRSDQRWGRPVPRDPTPAGAGTGTQNRDHEHAWGAGGSRCWGGKPPARVREAPASRGRSRGAALHRTAPQVTLKTAPTRGQRGPFQGGSARTLSRCRFLPFPTPRPRLSIKPSTAGSRSLGPAGTGTHRAPQASPRVMPESALSTRGDPQAKAKSGTRTPKAPPDPCGDQRGSASPKARGS